MDCNYLDTISLGNLTSFLSRVRHVFPNFTTLNESYEAKLNEVKESLERYIEDTTLERPFLYLILGPPGAGKTHLMRSLVDQLKKEKKDRPIDFQAVNISEVLDPRTLHEFYENIVQNQLRNVFTVSLFDEVDVKWSDGSAIKHLINPIYDGSYWDGKRFRKFGRCAFFFAGSYLQDRDTLVKTQKLLRGLDLNKFLLDMYLEMLKQNDSNALQEIRAVHDFCYAQQRWRTDVDPRTDTIVYLRTLEKIRDFLSRIAGNVFEMIDVSAPLHLTQEAFAISGKSSVNPSPKLRAVELVRLIKMREQKADGFITFKTSSEPLLEYKNLLLCERLLRVLAAIEKRFKKLFGKNASEFKIERKLLNFLTVVPLINAMRSLEQLINKLDLPKDGVIKQQTPFKAEEISMIVHNSEEFSDPLQVWREIARHNSALAKKIRDSRISHDDNIVVPFQPADVVL